MYEGFFFSYDSVSLFCDPPAQCSEVGCTRATMRSPKGISLQKCCKHQHCTVCGIDSAWSALLCCDCDHDKHKKLPLCSVPGCTYRTMRFSSSERSGLCGIHNVCPKCGEKITSASYVLNKCFGCKWKNKTACTLATFVIIKHRRVCGNKDMSRLLAKYVWEIRKTF